MTNIITVKHVYLNWCVLTSFITITIIWIIIFTIIIIWNNTFLLPPFIQTL